MNRKEITRHELIGQAIEIVASKNKDNLGLKGKIVDETKNTIMIKTKKGHKRLMKNNITTIIKNNGKKIKIKGEKISGRPKDRIKSR